MAGMRQRSPQGFNRAGFVKIGEETYPCQLTNLSVTGATIVFDGPIDLPERFAVQLTADPRLQNHLARGHRDRRRVRIGGRIEARVYGRPPTAAGALFPGLSQIVEPALLPGVYLLLFQDRRIRYTQEVVK
jgi:hypothetical protein